MQCAAHLPPSPCSQDADCQVVSEAEQGRVGLTVIRSIAFSSKTIFIPMSDVQSVLHICYFIAVLNAQKPLYLWLLIIMCSTRAMLFSVMPSLDVVAGVVVHGEMVWLFLHRFNF